MYYIIGIVTIKSDAQAIASVVIVLRSVIKMCYLRRYIIEIKCFYKKMRERKVRESR